MMQETGQDRERNAVQEHILDIFRDIVRVCELLGIPYFIMGGTALGAFRHGGFIPWDDDLDIGMEREHYERFLREAPRHLREDLFLQTFESEPASPFYFAKVRKEHTEFTEYYCRDLKIHSGIYVDIFPYDHVPDTRSAQRRYYRQMKCLLNLYIAKSVRETSIRYHGIRRVVYGAIRRTLRLLVMPVPKERLYHLLDGRMQAYNGKPSAYLGYGGLPKIQVRAADLSPAGEIGFEGMRVRCPNHIEAYLADNYGDYMKLPPEKERKGHAPYRVRV